MREPKEPREGHPGAKRAGCRALFPVSRMANCHHATKDQYLASFLLAEDAVLAGVTRLGPKRVEARFVADWRLHELLRLYHSGRAIPLVPSRLFDALKRIKSLARERR